MFFWLQAAALLRPASGVVRVVLEHDKAAGVDDVAVLYAPPGINAGGRTCVADYYQVKYHVDRSSSYSSVVLLRSGVHWRDGDLCSSGSVMHAFDSAMPMVGTGCTWSATGVGPPDDALNRRPSRVGRRRAPPAVLYGRGTVGHRRHPRDVAGAPWAERSGLPGFRRMTPVGR